MMHRRFTPALAASVALSIAATGCGSGKSSSSASTAARSTPAATSPSSSAKRPAKRTHQPGKATASTHAAKRGRHAGGVAQRPSTGGAAIAATTHRTKAALRAAMGGK